MTNAPPLPASARERLLAAADELFYKEGVHTVGIDRVIAHAGVAKATLYNAFGSKDELIRAYLSRRLEARKVRMTERLARYATARDRLLGVFDLMAESFADPTFRGCAFVRASAETPQDSPITDVCDAARAWLKSLFQELGRAAGVSDPDLLAQQLAVVYDGATVTAQMDRNPSAALTARTVAAALIEAATRR